MIFTVHAKDEFREDVGDPIECDESHLVRAVKDALTRTEATYVEVYEGFIA